MKTENYITTLDYKGRKVEIIGEVHDEPIVRSGDAMIYSRIQFFGETEIGRHEVLQARLYEAQLPQNDLVTECEHYKVNFDKLLTLKLNDNNGK